MSDMSEYDVGMANELTPSREETRSYHDIPKTVDTTALDRIVTYKSPVVDMTQLPTQIGVRAIPAAAKLSLPFVDGTLVYDQPTWILAAIPGPTRADNHAAE